MYLGNRVVSSTISKFYRDLVEVFIILSNFTYINLNIFEHSIYLIWIVVFKKISAKYFKMNQILVWKDIDKLELKYASDAIPPEDFIKLSCTNDLVFLLDKGGIIWHGKVNTGMCLNLEKSDIKAEDIACSSTHLFFITENGRVFKADVNNISVQEEVILYEDANTCIHGYITTSQRIAVKHIEAGGMGVLFLSESGQLWALGDHPQLDISLGDGPKKVGFFEGRHVISMACGRDFNAVVVHKRDDHCPLGNIEVAGDEAEVFISLCPQCVNENIMSPLSPQSLTDCALDVKRKHSNDSFSVSTSTSKNIDSEDKRSDNENTSSSTEGDSVHRVKTKVTPENENSDFENNSDSAEEEKGDRMSRLLMNTEAARQFFTRQLSWMSSGGEELLAEVSGPTKIIKKNVTTMASFVYEGVKTVGDKVATLSRHVSGGSDNNSESFEEFLTDDLNPSSTSSLRCEWSCSGGCSDVSDRGAADKLALYLTRGARLIKTEVWAWGSSQHGQLGSGDIVPRNKPVVVCSLTHVGAMRVECGWSHCAAVTLTGRCALWGRNDLGQICDETKGSDQSAPLVWGHTSQAVTGSRHTLLLAPDNTLHWLGKHRPETLNSNNTELDISEYVSDKGCVPLRVLSSSDFSICVVGQSLTTDLKLNSDLANEQCYLEEMVSFHSTIVRPLSRRSCIEEIVSNLCSRYTDLVHLTALNVASLYQGAPSNILLQTHTDEHLLVYERYSSAVCNVIAMSAFVQIARAVDIPQRLITCFSDRLPSRKTSPENLLTFAFLSPLSRISFYKMMLSRGSSEASCEVQRWEVFCEAQEFARKQAEATRIFWESSGRLIETLRTPQRRLLRDSKTHSLTVYNASRFSNHWFILLSDAFVHISGTTQTIHSLDTLWVEPLQDSENLQNALIITTPEETLQLVAPSAHEKVEWILALQDALKKRLNRNPVPSVRTATYTFTKHATYKDATYTGRWVSGKLEGKGRMDWPDGKFYIGLFRSNQLHGHGRLATPNVSEYDGQWKDGLQNGYGCTKFNNGDVYEGYYKDGLACGYGTHKSGHFMTNSAYTYCGEWVSGLKQGYGVMDDITTGEKYMGCWNNNMRNGNGLIITRDGIYYEGIFSQNELTGQALMIFEDGSYYEGEMKSAGVFNGKGTMVFTSGDKLEGSMHGVWSEGIRVTGTFFKVPCNSVGPLIQLTKREKPKSYGKYSTHPNQKWKAIFRQCYSVMGVSLEQRLGVADREQLVQRESHKAWENVAAALGSQHGCGFSHRHHEKLQTIPDFGREHLDADTYKLVSSYLSQAFGSSYHPLGVALSELTKAYNNTYSLSYDHSHLLLQHAVQELHSIIERLYHAVRLLFPALPAPGIDLLLSDGEPCEVASMATVLHPEILPRVCPGLFDLYTHDNEQENDAFHKRLQELNQYSDETLMSFLDIERKLWMDSNGELYEQPFSLAIVTLQHLKTTFIPLEKFMVLRETFESMKEEVRGKLGEEYVWTTDRIIPLLEFVIVRSQILHLASEVKFMNDFMDERFKVGEFNYHFTNLNACYKHILEEKKSEVR